MCIIIYRPAASADANATIPEADLHYYHKANSDSWGMMWATGGQLQIQTGEGDYAAFHKSLRMVRGAVVVHLRTATTGRDSGIQPMRVNENIGFAHNGNFFEFSPYFGKGYADGLSDTARFNRDILQRLPGNFLHDAKRMLALKDYCLDNFSKVVLIASTGRVCILGEEMGKWQGGCWYSNYGIRQYGGFGFSGLYYYEAGQRRHKGGLPNPGILTGNWVQCLTCLGYYLDLQGDCESCCKYLALKSLAVTAEEKT